MVFKAALADCLPDHLARDEDEGGDEDEDHQGEGEGEGEGEGLFSTRQ